MKEERQAATGKGRPAAMKTAQPKATPIGDIEVVGEDRRLTGIGEFDRVLGGGVIPGSVILIGGDPGIGKTTLLLQALPRLATKAAPVLYVSGEESPRQIKMRGQRLGIDLHDLAAVASHRQLLLGCGQYLSDHRHDHRSLGLHRRCGAHAPPWL